MSDTLDDVLTQGFIDTSLVDDTMVLTQPRGRPKNLRKEPTTKILIEVPIRLKMALKQEASARTAKGETSSMSALVREACERHLGADSSSNTRR